VVIFVQVSIVKVPNKMYPKLFLLFTYEIWKVLVSLAFFFCKLSRFRTFYTKKTSLERKKNSVRHAALPSGRCNAFEISASFRKLGWIDALHTQNFEILTSLEQTQETKKITFQFFIKKLDGFNLGKRCLLRCLIWIFFKIGKF
jgi:hypothetical protein